jgi:type III restriction enzyme
VAETAAAVFMLEAKAGNQMKDPIVPAKKKTAEKWGNNASTHAQSYGGKSWRYVLIPHDEIVANLTLDTLVARFGV